MGKPLMKWLVLMVLSQYSTIGWHVQKGLTVFPSAMYDR
jgi:hypothetical protein